MNPSKERKPWALSQFLLKDVTTLCEEKLAHRGGESLERAENLSKLIALVSVDVSKAAATLLAAGQPLLRLHVHEVLEGALLRQVGRMHLCEKSKKRRFPSTTGSRRDQAGGFLEGAALIQASHARVGLPGTSLHFLYPRDADQRANPPPPTHTNPLCVAGSGSVAGGSGREL